MLWRRMARAAAVLVIAASGCSAEAQEGFNGKTPAGSPTSSTPKAKRTAKPAQADPWSDRVDRSAPDRENPSSRWDGFYGGGNVGGAGDRDAF
jgi:hypothetical protein